MVPRTGRKTGEEKRTGKEVFLLLLMVKGDVFKEQTCGRMGPSRWTSDTSISRACWIKCTAVTLHEKVLWILDSTQEGS